MGNKLILFFYTLIQIHFNLNAQVADSIKTENQEVDTVYLYQDPLIIRKTVYYKREQEDSSSWMTNVFVGPAYTYNHFSYCPNCDTYKSIYKNAFSSNNTNFIGGINISKIYKRVAVTGTAYLLMIGDKISNDSIHSANKYSTLNIGILIGYKIGNKKVSLIPSIGLSLSSLLQQKGIYLSQDLSWKSIQTSKLYYKYTMDLNIRTRVLWKFTKKTGGFIEPFGIVDLQNIVTSNKALFNLYKRTVGINIGLSHSW